MHLPAVTFAVLAVAWTLVAHVVACEAGQGTFRVTSYNVLGWPWPFAPGRSRLAEIGRMLREERPPADVVVLQEAGLAASNDLRARSGYPWSARGPGNCEMVAADVKRLRPRRVPSPRRSHLRRHRAPCRNVGSGLMILSRHPISQVRAMPFSRFDCAGWDCLANKGLLLVRVHPPGLPFPIQVVTTHMQAGASRDAVRLRQIQTLADFLAKQATLRLPLILAGDVNLDPSRAHFDRFADGIDLRSTGRACANDPRCALDPRYPEARYWSNTNDQQFFRDGAGIRLRPSSMTRRFYVRRADGTLAEGLWEKAWNGYGAPPPGAPAEDGDALSDHPTLEATYSVEW